MKVSFLTTLALDVWFILLDQPFLFLDYEVFLFDDGLQTLFVFCERLNLFIFVAESHLALQLVTLELFKLSFQYL